MIESAPTESPSWPSLEVELAPVCVVEGMWQDQHDSLAAFDEARLGATAVGRGNLYVLLDVSGDVEGRAEIEQELLETIRRSYAASRGSIAFGLSEAVRAANAHLFEMNLAATRQARRMAGISAVVLRGYDLYIAQAGPAAVYVETGGILNRYPAESDWFTEDAPLISPQGNASAPLGIRREFTCDLFHISVTAGDIFIIATRALSQLVGTTELAQNVAEHGAEDIANYLEELAAPTGGDLTALVGELIDPLTAAQVNEELAHDMPTPQPDVHEPDFEDDGLEPELELEPEPAATMNLTGVAAIPNLAGYAADSTTPFSDQDEIADETAEEKLARLRQERQQRRGTNETSEASSGIGRAISGVGTGLLAMVALIAGSFGRLVRAIDWEGIGASINRALNKLVSATIGLLLLIVRLVLPGAPVKQGIIPRRAPKEPVWLKAAAVLLPVMFMGLAGARFWQQTNVRTNQVADLVQQASALEAAAENNPDKNAAREQLNQALVKIKEARQARDSDRARSVFYKIQNQLYELDGVAVLYYLPRVAAFQDGKSNVTRVISSGSDIYTLDRGRGQVYHHTMNDSATEFKPSPNNGVILQVGDKIGTVTVDEIPHLLWVEPGGTAKPSLVAVTSGAILQYDGGENKWRGQAISDAAQWGDLRGAASFLGNVYLLDAQSRQILKYAATNTGFAAQSAPYFPANAKPDISRAVDLAIDGDVWVLSSSGAVQRFRAGQPVAFQLSGLDTPLKNPSGIFTRPEVDAIYIADSGNQRIVEFDKNGRFVSQFKPNAEAADTFSALKALFVNESKRKFLFVNGNSVYLSNVPK